MSTEIIVVPDLGGADSVDVIELCIEVGDVISEEQSLVVLESDKASMEIPSTLSGKVLSIKVKEGDQVKEGDALVELEVSNSVDTVPAEESSKPQTVETVSMPDDGLNAAAAQEASAFESTSSTKEPVLVPDLGGAESVDVIEISVAVGDSVEEGDSLIVVETDKASMEIPSSHSGKVVEVLVAEGAKVSQGDQIVVIEGVSKTTEATSSGAVQQETDISTNTPNTQAGQLEASSGPQTVEVPDLGGSDAVDVIEVSIAIGDEVEEGDSLVVVESDKASMEIPSTVSGKVIEVLVSEGAKVSQGDALAVIEGGAQVTVAVKTPDAAKAAADVKSSPESTASTPVAEHKVKDASEPEFAASSDRVYAGPSSRKLARQLGVDLTKLKGSGPRGRITKDDIRKYVKQIVQSASSGNTQVTSGSGIPPVPAVDFSQFGEIEEVKLSKIGKVTATNMSRSWLNVPHVTQFDEADITDMEAFRKSMKAEAEKRGVKLTPLPFLLLAAAKAMLAEPKFNCSLSADGESLIYKKYVHIGVAVDTPNGLLVPVIRDVDKKGLWDLAAETSEVAEKARKGKLIPRDMQGGCFTISSLGAIGGTGFTPIVNAPEVAIMGVSKSSMKPIWDGSDFKPRLMLPLTVSYDHRVINGADCGRFFTQMVASLSDLRRLLL